MNAQIQKDKLETDAEITSLKEEIQRLQKDIYQQMMEKDILEKAAELSDHRSFLLILDSCSYNKQ